MAKRSRQSRPMELNLTSMMDIVFQLIIFFLVVTNFSAAELPPLNPPDPIDSRARDPIERRRMIVNIVPGENDISASHVQAGGVKYPIGQYAGLTDQLIHWVASREEGMEVEVDLRADKGIHYSYVQPVMIAITAAGIVRVNLVAIKQKGSASSVE